MGLLNTLQEVGGNSAGFDALIAEQTPGGLNEVAISRQEYKNRSSRKNRISGRPILANRESVFREALFLYSCHQQPARGGRRGGVRTLHGPLAGPARGQIGDHAAMILFAVTLTNMCIPPKYKECRKQQRTHKVTQVHGGPSGRIAGLG